MPFRIKMQTLLLLIAAFAAPASAHEGHTHAAGEAVRAAAQDLMGALRPELRERITFPFESAQRTQWHYVPRERSGVALGEMNAEERRAAHALLRAALSNQGYLKATTVMSLESVLRVMEADRPGVRERRDPEKYWVAVYGDPGGERPWGWRIEGHHLSLNFSSITGRVVGTFPAFYGANPAEVRDGPRTGLRVLGDEEELGRQLMASLSVNQQATAKFQAHAPEDILTVPGEPIDLGRPAGIPASALDANQRGLLWRIIRLYAHNLRGELAEGVIEEIDSAGVDNIHFAWAGGTAPDERCYYRLHGPTFVLEFDKTGPNHIHTVWHSTTNDFGLDALERHYEESEHRANGEGPSAGAHQ